MLPTVSKDWRMTRIWVLGFAGMAIIASPVEASSYKLTTLAEFSPATGGYCPITNLALDAGGNLYGTTLFGGAAGGTVFRLTTDTHELSFLAEFDQASGERSDGGLLIDVDGNIYGTTVLGGNSNNGTVFRLAATSNLIAPLAFFNGANGSNPFGSLLPDTDGNLYGTTRLGGAHNKGTVFRLDASTHAITTLASFDGVHGAGPASGLYSDGSGSLYGTTESGGAHDNGTVYRLDVASGELATLATFDEANGAAPYAGLIADDNGNLYGTTSYGGAHDAGTVFRVNIGAKTLTTLAMFDVENGLNPYGTLIADADGNLYGTTFAGGAFTFGTVFRVAAGTHALETLATFDGANGASPFGGLIAEADGSFYGTTNYGGTYNCGTVFKLVLIPEPSAIILAMLVSIICVRRDAWGQHIRRARHI
jgi:uncharacterized repeat protein (TIGR03803 family)